MPYKVKVNNDFLNLSGDSPDDEILKAIEKTVAQLHTIKPLNDIKKKEEEDLQIKK
jgi:hypothetical protein